MKYADSQWNTAIIPIRKMESVVPALMLKQNFDFKAS